MNSKIIILLLYLCLPWVAMAKPDSTSMDERLFSANQSLTLKHYKTVDSLAKLVIADATRLNDKKREAHSWQLLGQVAKAQDQHEDAHRYLQNAKSCWSALKNRHKVGMLCKEIADVWDAFGDYSEQLKMAEQGLRIFEQLQDPIWIGKLTNCIANAHKNMGNNGLAVTYYEQALQQAEGNKDLQLLGMVQYNLGDLYYYLDDLDRAQDLVLQAKLNFEAIRDSYSLAATHNVLGAIAWDEGFQEKARINFVRSAELAAEQGIAPMAFDAYLNLAELALEQGELNAAKSASNQAQLFMGDSESRMDESAMQGLQARLEKAVAERRTHRLTVVVQWLYFILIALGGYVYIYRGLQKQKQAAQDLKMREIEGQKQLELREMAAQKALELKKKEDEMRLAAEKAQMEHMKHVQQLIALSNQQANAIRLKTIKEERKELAGRVHGNISSQLVAARWLINNFKEKLEKQAINTEDLVPIVTGIEATYESSRNVEDLLEHLPLNYAMEIENFLKPLCRNTDGKPRINFSSAGLERGLPAEIGFNVYEIVQMATANTLSHADASEFSCQINLVGDELVLLLEDDGRGFTVQEIKSGSGIRNMVTLVEKMNGEIDIDSGVDRGTHISITIPVNVGKNRSAA